METAAELIPEDADLGTLRRLAAGCTACDLHETGTQTVFGEGPADARLVVVGEQPGDQEDLEGEPFVGPAGAELDRGFEAVGIDRSLVYVTNTVKHFKWSERRGKRRIHEKPNAIEIRSCLPWLQAEVARVEPEVVLLLGATAAKAVLGSGFRVTKQRGEVLEGVDGRPTVATLHPSSVLRSRSDEQRHAARAAFHADLEVVAGLLQGEEG
ncbi:MAG: UdgX family uracil-DNA binding protein [Actinobacteria bacterium]|nr:UdgX family uracil-DNA binding protein [Actinomycetota bacterium]